MYTRIGCAATWYRASMCKPGWQSAHRVRGAVRCRGSMRYWIWEISGESSATTAHSPHSPHTCVRHWASAARQGWAAAVTPASQCRLRRRRTQRTGAAAALQAPRRRPRPGPALRSHPGGRVSGPLPCAGMSAKSALSVPAICPLSAALCQTVVTRVEEAIMISASIAQWLLASSTPFTAVLLTQGRACGQCCHECMFVSRWPTVSAHGRRQCALSPQPVMSVGLCSWRS
jgi:hypothetical protein